MGETYDKTLRYIENSKIVLNLHAFEPWSRQEQERIGFLLANKKCVISEISQENYFGDAILESDVNTLTNRILFALSDDRWKRISINGYNMFKNNECQKLTNF
jgi:hypothetical protein